MKFYLFTLLYFTGFWVYGQNKEKIESLNDIANILQNQCSDSIKQTIIETSDNDLFNQFYFMEWPDTIINGKIKRYLTDRGISDYVHQQKIIRIVIKQTLLGNVIFEDIVLKPFKLIEDKWRAEDRIKYTTDSLRGQYIPIDLTDCLNILDSDFDDSSKNYVKQWTEDEFSARSHRFLGMQIRNGWQLWGGSRLTKYFNSLGVFDAENMSGIILVSYHRHLTGKIINLEEQIKEVQQKMKLWDEPKKETYPKNAGELEFCLILVYYDSKNGKEVSIHISRNKETREIWIYSYYLGWANISEPELQNLEQVDYSELDEVIYKLFNENKVNK